LSNNKIADISTLANLTEVLTLRLENNLISDISALLTLDKARNINLFGNDEIKCADLGSLASAVEGRALNRPDVCLN
jgi:Leucine-rich repeat (LRR) protein